MAALKWILIVVGLLFVIFGTIFALQGANIIGGSAIMSGNSTYIYVEAALAIISVGLVVLGAVSSRSKSPSTSPPAGGAVPSTTVGP